MSVVNKPDISGPLTWFYVVMAALVAAVGVTVGSFYLEMPQAAGIVGLIVVTVVEAILVSILVSIYRTDYSLTQDALVIGASKFIGGTKRVPLESIETAERTLIPFGIRLFGASGYGGYYYFPSVGRAFMAITNFKDGVLIRTQHGNYLITPKDPESFIESMMRTAKSKQKKNV